MDKRSIEEKQLKSIIVIISFLLVGCAGTSELWLYDPDSMYANENGMRREWYIKTKGSAKHLAEKEKFETDSKQKSFLENAININAAKLK